MGVTYMLTWTNHRLANVVTWLQTTNQGRMLLKSPKPSTQCQGVEFSFYGMVWISLLGCILQQNKCTGLAVCETRTP